MLGLLRDRAASDLRIFRKQLGRGCRAEDWESPEGYPDLCDDPEAAAAADEAQAREWADIDLQVHAVCERLLREHKAVA